MLGCGGDVKFYYVSFYCGGRECFFKSLNDFGCWFGIRFEYYNVSFNCIL